MVGSATSSIRMTMHADEEVRNPIPEEYFVLLQKKVRDGVKVTRIGFGTEQKFAPLASRVFIDHPNYVFIRTEALDYRRMLLADGTKLLFARTDAMGRRVFCTDDASTIGSYAEYFDRQAEAARGGDY